MELNKHILLVMKWLDDPESVSKDELIDNRKSADAATYAAADAAAADLAADAATYADKWIVKYFERTGEDKQDYIDAIEAEKKPQEPESKEWVPNVGEECLVEYPYGDGCFKPFHGKKVTILGCCPDGDGEYVFTAHGSNGFIALYANGFRPLKTEKEKEREAFIDSAVEVMNSSLDDSQAGWAAALFDAGFKAPEGE